MEFITCRWGNTKWGFKVSVRTNNYNRSLDHVRIMVDKLKEDHPNQKIENDDITIVIYNTNSFRGMMGVEWCTKDPNKTYSEMDIAPCIY